MTNKSRNGLSKQVLFLALVAALGNVSHSQQAAFHWLKPSADGPLFKQVEAAFSDELEADESGHTGNVLPMTVKYIHRVGILDNTALVIVGYKENKDDLYPIFKAFSFRMDSRDRTVIRGTREKSEWLPMWEFRTIAHFESKESTDVVFRYFSCTECEAEELLGAFRYDVRSKSWTLRHWSNEDGDDLLIGSNDQFADEGTLSFDCLYTVRDLTRDGLDEVAVRCRESVEGQTGKPKPKKDETLLYALKEGVFVRRVLHPSDPINVDVQAALCQTTAKTSLCGKK